MENEGPTAGNLEMLRRLEETIHAAAIICTLDLILLRSSSMTNLRYLSFNGKNIKILKVDIHFYHEDKKKLYKILK